MFGKFLRGVVRATTRLACISCVTASTTALVGCDLIPERYPLSKWADNNALLKTFAYNNVTLGGGLASYPRLVAETDSFEDAMSSVNSLREFLQDHKKEKWEVHLSWPTGSGRSELRLSQWSNFDAPALRHFGLLLPRGAEKQTLTLGGKAQDYKRGPAAELAFVAEDPVATALSLQEHTYTPADSYTVLFGEEEEKQYGLVGRSVSDIVGAARSIDAIRTASPAAVLSGSNYVSVPTIDDVFAGYFSAHATATHATAVPGTSEEPGANITPEKVSAGAAIEINNSTVSISTDTPASDVHLLRGVLDSFGVNTGNSSGSGTDEVRVGIKADHGHLRINTGSSYNSRCPEASLSTSRQLLTEPPAFSQRHLTLSGCWKSDTSWLISNLDRPTRVSALPVLTGILDEPGVTEFQIFGSSGDRTNEPGKVSVSVNEQKLAAQGTSTSDDLWVKIMPLIRKLMLTSTDRVILQEHRGTSSDTSTEEVVAEVSFSSTADGQATEVLSNRKENEDRVRRLIELWNASA